jgi:DNA-binding MarR family transcriptional regulator
MVNLECDYKNGHNVEKARVDRVTRELRWVTAEVFALGSSASRATLPPRQLATLLAIERFTSEHGHPPTFRELGSALGITSSNGVNDHISALERKGFIKRMRNKVRAIRVIK